MSGCWGHSAPVNGFWKGHLQARHPRPESGRPPARRGLRFSPPGPATCLGAAGHAGPGHRASSLSHPPHTLSPLRPHWPCRGQRARAFPGQQVEQRLRSERLASHRRWGLLGGELFKGDFSPRGGRRESSGPGPGTPVLSEGKVLLSAGVWHRLEAPRLRLGRGMRGCWPSGSRPRMLLSVLSAQHDHTESQPGRLRWRGPEPSVGGEPQPSPAA